jgi:translation elongation factor EF-G
MAEQVSVDSPDITAAIDPGHVVLVVSVYVPCADAHGTTGHLRKITHDRGEGKAGNRNDG